MNMSMEWRENGEVHREDGPAVERMDGTKEWWLKGKKMSEEIFEKEMSCGKRSIP